MNNIEKLEKIQEICKLQAKTHNWDDFQQEIYIHLENGDKAYSTLHSFVFDKTENKVLCKINNKSTWIKIEDIHALGY